MNLYVKICNINRDLRGKAAGASGYYCWIDFLVVFKNNTREIELYLQPTFDEDGFVIGFGGVDTDDDSIFLPGEFEDMVIDAMNYLIKRDAE